MAIDTAAKRSASATYGTPWMAGTRIPSGASTAADRGATLGAWYFAYIPAVDYVTTRLTLVGTSIQRLSITGQSEQRLSVAGQSAERLALIGSSP